MITTEQKQQIENFLSGKNLPLDLKLEILDHIMEQVDYKMGRENKDFATSLDEIDNSWKVDFKMRKGFPMIESRTKIHRDTIRKTNFEILKKSSLYYTAYLILSILLMIYSKEISNYSIFAIYISLVLAFLFIAIFDFKTILSSTKMNTKKISYLQKGTAMLITFTCFICINLLPNFNTKFDTYYDSLQNLFDSYSFTIDFFSSIILFNVFIFAWIHGFLYYLEYKKALKFLEQKINFRL